MNHKDVWPTHKIKHVKLAINETKIKNKFQVFQQKFKVQYNLKYSLYLSIQPSTHMSIWAEICTHQWAPDMTNGRFWGRGWYSDWLSCTFELFCDISIFDLRMCHFYGNHQVTLLWWRQSTDHSPYCIMYVFIHPVPMTCMENGSSIRTRSPFNSLLWSQHLKNAS